MSSHLVYLCGPITGKSFSEADSWREEAKKHMFNLGLGIRCLSPLRSAGAVRNEEVMKDSYDDMVLTSSKGIVTQDRWDCQRCDLMLANFASDRVSVGSCIELGWANAYRKPIVSIIPKGSLHDHAMVREVSGWVVQTLKDAVEVVSALLSTK